MSSRFLSLTRIALLAIAAVPVVLTTGCGFGGMTPATDTPVFGLKGIANGGPSPDAGATVKLYATATAAYGTSSTLLATATANASGVFTFTSPATCPAGQQAYVTASGGNPGFGGTNSQILLMAALGPCSGISSSTYIVINEMSTVAAGYALSNFIGISGTTVNVSAPATNNAAAASCTGTGSSMTCNSSGLAHAFLNAANLVNDVALTGTPLPSGQAYTTPPGNTNGVVPALELSTIGNILQACVNSAGGIAGDTSNCGKLFTNTTPPTTYTASPITPTNTLQAVINMAKFPTMTSTQNTALFGLTTGFTYYQPALAAAPPDWTVAIAYTSPTSAAASSSTNFIYTFFTVLDVNDFTYSFSEAGNGSGFGPVFVNGMGSNGTNGYKSASLTAPLCAAASFCGAGVDTTGHIWLANTNTTSNINVYEIATADGSLTQTFTMPTGSSPNSAAVDRNNNVYVTSANNTQADVFIKTPAAGSFSILQSNSADTTETGPSPEFIAIDGAGSLWNTNFAAAASTSQTTYFANTGTISAPVFGAQVLATEAATNGNVESISIDSANNGWVNNQTTLWKVAPAATAPAATLTITGLGGASATVKAGSSARFSTLDGDGNIILPDNVTGAVIWQFYASTGNFTYFAPCIGNSGTACNSATGVPKVASPRNAVTDATGSIWISVPVAVGTTSNLAGSIVQIIGTAAPTWGQLSYGHPGVRP